MKQRYLLFDIFKGLLIIFVIIGHFTLGSIQENPLREFLYFFHMPLFLGITGFWVSQSSITSSFIKILEKYKNRLIIPTLIAFLFYNSFYHNFSIRSLIYPYYHLWYIPAVFIFIFYLQILTKVSKYLLIFIVFVIFSIIITIYFEAYSQWEIDGGRLYYYLGDKRFYYFFSYFGLGYLLKIRPLKISYPIVLLCIILGLSIFFLIDFPLLKGVSKVFTNYSLIYLVIVFSLEKSSFIKPNYVNNVLQKIGQVSLPLYFWHIIIVNFGKSVFIEGKYIQTFIYTVWQRKIFYYGFEIIAMSIFIYVVIKFEKKNRYIDKYVYGRE